jgi:TonB family protein
MIMFIYIAKLVFCSGLLYAYYLLVLRNTLSHQYNRYYILFSSILAIVLPLLTFKLDISPYDSNYEVVKTLQAVTVDRWEKEYIVAPRSTFPSSIITRANLLIFVYIAGLLFFLIPVIKSLLFIRRLCNMYEHAEVDGYRVYNTSEPAAPFSFFNLIFWNRHIDLATREGQYILCHEIFHIRSNHSADLAWMQGLGIIFWFNPFYHLMKTELQTIHEFLADQHASADTNVDDYAELLVLHVMQQKRASITNHFFNNQIKRRVNMIMQTKFKRKNYLGRVMALPVLFVISCAFTLNVNHHSTTEIFQKLQRNDTLSPEQISKIDVTNIEKLEVNKDVIIATLRNGENLLIRRKDFETYAPKGARVRSTDKDPIFPTVENEPGYPGGPSGWMAYLNKTFKYPPEAIAGKIEGTVLVQFLVDQDGTVSDVQAIKGPETGGLREEAIRVFRESGKWVPAKQFGVTVKAYKIQPITFKLNPEH